MHKLMLSSKFQKQIKINIKILLLVNLKNHLQSSLINSTSKIKSNSMKIKSFAT